MADSRAELTSYAYRKMREQILGESDVCLVCGHLQADAIDHIIPVAKGGPRMARDNLAPIHGVDGCPICGRKCNNEKGDKLVSEITFPTSRDWFAGP